MSFYVGGPRQISSLATFLILVVFVGACSTATEPDICGGDSSTLVGFGSCVVFEDGGQLGANRDVVEMVVRQTLSSVNQLMSVADIRIRVIADAAQTIPELGLGGFTPDGHEIRVFFDPTLVDLQRSVSNDLLPLLAHEIHHVKRIRTVGYGSTLLAAAVSEGLADHFSVEVAGVDPPPWSTALTGSDLVSWTIQARQFGTGAYDHGGWFFGTDPQVPRWAGYAIGFELVRAYLVVNPERRPSDLFDEPTSAFLS